MKILFIHCTYQFHGGECNVVKAEINLLRSAGHRVRLLQFNNTTHKFLKLILLPFNIGSYFKTISFLKKYRPDVVHIHNLHFGASPAVIYAVKKMNIPVVATLHNFRYLCPSATLFHNGELFLDSLTKNFSWMAVRKRVYKNSAALTFWLSLSNAIHKKIGTFKLIDRYIVLSNHSREIFSQSLLQIKEQRFVVKQNFTAFPALQNQKRQDHFLFIGRLSIEKGIEMLLQTFAALPFTIQIAGDGPQKELVKKYAGLHSNIIYLGALTKQEINRELQSCSALVFPSIWYEGMPLTIIESFACGTPVIAANLGAMATMIHDGQNGLHFEKGNKSDFATQLKKWYYMDEFDREACCWNALKTYEKYYTPQKNQQQLLAIYESVISKPAVKVQ